MRHLNYFLYLAFFTGVHCKEEPICEEGKLSSHSEKICCNGEIYNIRRDIEVHDICNAEPKDENLSYEDSIWLAYDCNVKIALNSTPLTLKSYVSLLADLPESRQTDIWNKITTESVPASGNVEVQKINTIRSYWEGYFEAIRKVCVNNMTVDQLEPFTFNTTGDAYKTHVIAILKPSAKCRGGPVPRNIIYEYFQRKIKIEGLQYQRVCKAKMEVAFGNVSLYSIRTETNIFCSIASEYELNLDEILNTNSDIDHKVWSIFPKFLSKSAKAVAVDKAKQLFLMESRTNSTSLQELLQWHQQQLTNHRALNKNEKFNRLDTLATAVFFIKFFRVYKLLKTWMCTGVVLAEG